MEMESALARMGAVWRFDLRKAAAILRRSGPYVTDSEWASAEELIRYRFPEEFTMFITHFGSAHLFGDKVMAIYPVNGRNGDLSLGSDDLVGQYYINLRNGLLEPGEVAFLETNDDGTFFFRCMPWDSPNPTEGKVFRVFGNDMEKKCVAPSLISFLALYASEEDH